ncbi:hypothetical protein [Crassaminicella profunda]|uniref:hypothetical protein n=1 Tax=Crassaminicella profunda TaxID=1286698 RepID=UPI001CA70DAD|nr:hypothetical protein [Crassaminicella profunda]QZY56322.1 hypothetical protein K7H06_04890 [Crassaminicella profunda]
MTDNKAICFSCLTPYHVFVSYILSKTVYKDNYKIILISDHHLKKVYINSKKLAVWDELILIEEKNKPFHLIQQQFDKIDFTSIHVLHYFSWGSIFNSILMNAIPNHTKIILTDEGYMTYRPKEASEFFKNKNNLQRNPLDFNTISEIWLFDKRLYISTLNKPLKNIELKKYLDSKLKYELCNELNILFDYQYEKKDYDIVFFDQCFTLTHKTSYIEEKYLLMNIIKVLKDFKILIKKHPSDSKYKYTGLGVDILEHEGIPWEVIYLNEYINNPSNLQNKIYMTYSSSAMINARTVFKDLNIHNHFFSLIKLLHNFLDITTPTILLEKYYNQFKKSYNENIYEIESFIDLQNILNKNLLSIKK